MRLSPRLSLSPRGFLTAALGLSVVFGILHLIGGREETRFLSGTQANLQLGMLYLVFYFSFVVVVPTLVLAAGVDAVLEKLNV